MWSQAAASGWGRVAAIAVIFAVVHRDVVEFIQVISVILQWWNG